MYYRNKSVIVFRTQEYGSVGFSVSAHAHDPSSKQLRSLMLRREEEHEGRQNQKPFKRRRFKLKKNKCPLARSLENNSQPCSCFHASTTANLKSPQYKKIERVLRTQDGARCSATNHHHHSCYRFLEKKVCRQDRDIQSSCSCGLRRSP